MVGMGQAPTESQSRALRHFTLPNVREPHL
jgi:hypothetical protein